MAELLRFQHIYLLWKLQLLWKVTKTQHGPQKGHSPTQICHEGLHFFAFSHGSEWPHCYQLASITNPILTLHITLVDRDRSVLWKVIPCLQDYIMSQTRWSQFEQSLRHENLKTYKVGTYFGLCNKMTHNYYEVITDMIIKLHFCNWGIMVKPCDIKNAWANLLWKTLKSIVYKLLR